MIEWWFCDERDSLGTFIYHERKQFVNTSFRILLLPAFLLVMLVITATPVSGQYDCPPGMEWSRETVACEQTICPPEAGRTYTLECKCPEGTVAQSDELTDPATGNVYHLVAACVLPSENLQSIENTDGGGEETLAEPDGETDCKSVSGACEENDNSSSWWSRQRTGVRIALVAGGLTILVGGAIAAGLITWAGVSAVAGATAASLSSVTPFAAEFVTAWATKKAMKVFAQRLARQTGKYLTKKIGHRASAAEVRQLMLQTINQELRKRGFGEWSAVQFDTFIKGIDLFW
jgi:hypothetical protein